MTFLPLSATIGVDSNTQPSVKEPVTMTLTQDPTAILAERDRVSAEGAWQVLDYQLPFPAAHAALLPTSKVLFLPGGRKQNDSPRPPGACLWDFESGELKTWEMATDFSLGAHCQLPDGRLILIGGARHQGAIRLKETFLFDPLTEDWLRINDIPERGACPTLLERADGKILAIGGSGTNSIHCYEKAGGWSTQASAEPDWPLYPQLALMEDGSVAYSGQHFGGRDLLRPGFLRPGGRFDELPEWSVPAGYLFTSRDQGATVLLPPAQSQRVMVIGGGSPPEPDAYMLNLSKPDPRFQPAEPMRHGRANFATVILPDRSVLVCGGVRRDPVEGLADATEAEIFNPSEGSWCSAGSATVPRREHSSALLLPDGSVLTAGSTDAGGRGELRLELYHPPYLFRGNRPVLADAPREVSLSESFSIKTTDSDIRWIHLVKPAAVSHGVDSGQRLVDLPFESKHGGQLQATVPSNPNIAPPGHYLLFLVNHKGIPSLGRWVRLLPGVPGGKHFTVNLAPEPALNGSPVSTRGKHSWTGPEGSADGVVSIQDPLPGLWEGAAGKVPATAVPPESPAPAPVQEEVGPAAQLVEEMDDLVWEEWPDRVAGGPAAQAAGSAGAVVPAEKVWQEDSSDLAREASPAQVALGEPVAEPHSASGAWSRWASPALIIGSASLLGLSMVVEAPPLRVAAAFIFLLFAPGLALVGLVRPDGLEALVALSIGLSLALETILGVAMLYLELWSVERIFFILLLVSLAGAAIQLFRTAFRGSRAVAPLKHLEEGLA